MRGARPAGTVVWLGVLVTIVPAGMVSVEFADGVTPTECTVTNFTVGQVEQSWLTVVVEFEDAGVAVAELLSSVVVESDPGSLIGGQVGQGLYSVSVELCPGIVTGGQVGQGL